MKRLTDAVINFFKAQGYVVVSTIDGGGFVHNSCKGIIKIESTGKVYLIDLYRSRTYANILKNPKMSITAVDEHHFKGYCIKGKAKIISKNIEFKSGLIKAWEDRITSRITQRLLRNVRGEKGHPKHPESLLPQPEYVIIMETEKIVDLTPQHIKLGGL